MASWLHAGACCGYAASREVHPLTGVRQGKLPSETGRIVVLARRLLMTCPGTCSSGYPRELNEGP